MKLTCMTCLYFTHHNLKSTLSKELYYMYRYVHNVNFTKKYVLFILYYMCVCTYLYYNIESYTLSIQIIY